MSDILEKYKALHAAFMATNDQGAEDALIDEMDILWYEMTPEEREQARQVK